MTFEDFWDAYDYKVGRVSAERAWKKVTPKDKEVIRSTLGHYLNSTFKDGRYPSRKHPTTYINNKSWYDEPIRTKQKNAGGINPGVKANLREFIRCQESGENFSPLAEPVRDEEIPFSNRKKVIEIRPSSDR